MPCATVNQRREVPSAVPTASFAAGAQVGREAVGAGAFPEGKDSSVTVLTGMVVSRAARVERRDPALCSIVRD
jgi:hypothetical protein